MLAAPLSQLHSSPRVRLTSLPLAQRRDLAGTLAKLERLDTEYDAADEGVPVQRVAGSRSLGGTPVVKEFNRGEIWKLSVADLDDAVNENGDMRQSGVAREDALASLGLVEFSDFPNVDDARRLDPSTSRVSMVSISSVLAEYTHDPPIPIPLPDEPLDDHSKIPFPISSSLPHHLSVDLIDFSSPLPSPTTSPRKFPSTASQHSLHVLADAAAITRGSLTLERTQDITAEEEETSEEEAVGDELDDTETEEEEEDPDAHPLYTLLSSSTLPSLSSTWQTTTLILVPPRRTLPSLVPFLPTEISTAASPTETKGFEFIRGAKGEQAGSRNSTNNERVNKEQLELYVMLHAFKPQGRSGEVWRSIGNVDLPSLPNGFVRVRLEPARNLIHVEWVEAVEQESKGAIKRPTLAAESSEDSIDFPITPTDSTIDLPRLPSDELPLPSPFSAASYVKPLPAIAIEHPTARKLKSSALSSRALQIVSESTIYRRIKKAVPANDPFEPPPPSSKPPPSRTGFRAPKWLRRGSSTANTNPPPAISSIKNKEPMLEKVRVIAVDGEIVVNWPGSHPLYSNRRPPHSNRTASSIVSRSRSLVGVASASSLHLPRAAPTPSEVERQLARTGSLASSRSGKSSHGHGWGTVGNAVGVRRDFVK